MTSLIRVLVPAACACMALWAHWAAAQPAATAQAAADAPAENRSLRQLRRDMRRAQEHFTALYNELNQDREQQIVCDDSAATGTRLTRRSCTTRAMQEARARDAVDFLAAASLEAALEGGAVDSGPIAESLQASSPDPEMPRRYILEQASPSAENSRDAYNANMERLLFQHPELHQAYVEYLEARQRLQAAQRR